MTPIDPHPIPAGPPSEALRLRVLESLQRRPAPHRTDRLVPGLKRAALAIAATLAVFFALLYSPWPTWLDYGGLAHAAGRPETTTSWILLGVIALAAGATWLALPPRRSMLSPARGQLLAVAIGVPLLTFGWLSLWHLTPDVDPVHGWRCLALTALTAPWPFLLLAWLGRRLDPRHPALTGAAMGAAAGSWGGVMVELWCPRADWDHLLLGHVLPIALVALAGACYGAWRFRLRTVR
jgi:hypothetical protein